LDTSDQEKIVDMLQKLEKEEFKRLMLNRTENIVLNRRIRKWLDIKNIFKEHEFNKNMDHQYLMIASGLNMKNAEDLIHNYEKQKTRQKRMYENNLGEQVSLGVILLANQGFMSPDYEKIVHTLDASDQDKFLHMLQNEIVTLDNMINDDLVEDENHYFHFNSDTMKSQKNLLFKRSILGGTCSLENENYYNKNENLALKTILGKTN